MNILYTFLNFNSFTGSELYYYELAREMRVLGHQVTIASSCGGEIEELAISHGIKCVSFKEIKSFKEFDVIHASHKAVVGGLRQCNIHIPLVVTCHSEILEQEKVPDYGFIDHYIGIRPAIHETLPKDRRSLIYNPIDFSKFNNEGLTDEGFIFFPGTINYLRVQPIEKMKKDYPFKPFLLMGDTDFPDKYNLMSPSERTHVWMKKCSFSAGIIRGRTYIESVLCGKDHINYNVDKDGNIIDFERLPAGDYLNFGDGINVHKSKFDSKIVAQEIELIYRSVI